MGKRKGGKVEGRRQKNTNLTRWKNKKVERLKVECEKVSRWNVGSWKGVKWEGGTVGGKVERCEGVKMGVGGRWEARGK